MNRIVIGVVGGSDKGLTKISDQTERVAFEIGKAIADQDGILLTGGHPTQSKRSVKKAVMDGAISQRSGARMIGILPEQEQGATGWSFPAHESRHQRYLYTDLHDCRNALNGSTPDVLLALKGGAGTLSEIAYALASNRYVIFVDSWEHLKAMRCEEKAKLERIVKEIEEDQRLSEISETSRDVLRHLDRVLIKPIEVVPACATFRATAQAACEKVTDVNRAGAFPTLAKRQAICDEVNTWLTWSRGDTSS